MKCGVEWNRVRKYQALIFCLTFLSYASYTLARLPYSIAKSSLNPDKDRSAENPGWEPFNGSDGSTYLGLLDTLFLAAYAGGLFVAGHIGDRSNLRYFIGIGMVGAGLCVVMFGLGKVWGIHAFAYYAVCNMAAGLFQSTGWPGNVTIMSRWFGKGKRGTIIGFWSVHSSVGNIIGRLMAAGARNAYGWQAAFIIPGAVCSGVGIIQALFLVPHPRDVLKEASGPDGEQAQPASHDHHQPMLPQSAAAAKPQQSTGQVAHATAAMSELNHENLDAHEHVSFWRALQVPGVIAYSFCLFFSKLVAYAFVFWLPYYLSHVGYGDNAAGQWSVIYDIGGVAGGMLAGYLSDRLGMRGIVSFVMLILTIPALYFYSLLAPAGDAANGFGMVMLGILVNGPYTLVSGAVAADLGSHESLKNNPKAMSTVTGIIDGTGSVGGALQGVLIGVISGGLGWSAVFYMLMLCCLGSALCILRIVRSELRQRHEGRKSSQNGMPRSSSVDNAADMIRNVPPDHHANGTSINGNGTSNGTTTGALATVSNEHP